MITGVTSHHLCRILLVRSRSSVLLTLKRRGLGKGMDTRRQDVTEGHLGVCPSLEAEKPMSWSLVIWSSGKCAQNLTRLCSSLMVVFYISAHMCGHTCATHPTRHMAPPPPFPMTLSFPVFQQERCICPVEAEVGGLA